ncbi:transcriptional regulatory protein AlgP-like [Helicoverpa zea]|uniref:transcriptional regulatory protein AlgP-like n=1 Tax=Helicoverpa zea TaxID=7113 RepID=UPI001F5A9D82|nr:transcriptional regulatory protein AlgP-like [Helicoverpa zea]
MTTSPRWTLKSPHVARTVRDYLEDVTINVMEWPARSPDLNPIEHVWDELKRRVRARSPAPTHLQALLSAIEEGWNVIPQEFIIKLKRSMKNRRYRTTRRSGPLSVPVRPTNFRPVPSQPPGPATVGRAQQVRAPPPQPRPSAVNKQARPDTQPAPSDAVPPRSDAPPARSAASASDARAGAQAACSAARPARSTASAARPAAHPAPSDAVPPRSDAPPARPYALPARAVARPAAPPERSAALPARAAALAARLDALPIAQPARSAAPPAGSDGPAAHLDTPSPHPAGSSAPAAATPAHPTLCYKRTVTPQRLWFASHFSPPPPRTSARDSPAAMPGSLSRSGSEMSVASGEYSPIRDQSPPHLEDASPRRAISAKDGCGACTQYRLGYSPSAAASSSSSGLRWRH